MARALEQEPELDLELELELESEIGTAFRHLGLYRRCFKRVLRFSPGLSLNDIMSESEKNKLLDKFIEFTLIFVSLRGKIELVTSDSYTKLLNDIEHLFSQEEVIFAFVNKISEKIDTNPNPHIDNIRHILANPLTNINYRITYGSHTTESNYWNFDFKSNPNSFIKSIIKSSNLPLKEIYLYSIYTGSLVMVKIITDIFLEHMKFKRHNILNPAIYMAVTNNKINIVKYLIDLRKDIFNTSGGVSQQYIYLANSKGFTEMAEFLTSLNEEEN